MVNPPGYFDKYYEENRDEINRKRNEKYHNDPDYRSRVLKASRNYRNKKRDKRTSCVRRHRFQVPRTFEVDGGTLHLFSVGYFALSLKRSVQSINHWEKTTPYPILPMTPYRDSRGFRYYTKEMMAVVKRTIGDRRRLFPVSRKMHDEIKSAWEKLGVPVTKNTLDSALEATVLNNDR